MALINCSECKWEVSDKAAMCPNCGAPISSVYAAVLNKDLEKAVENLEVEE